MSKYIIRLDDAACRMDIKNWSRMEALLDSYDIHPLVGVIPKCLDEQMQVYACDETFWKKVRAWQKKNWTIALHGFEHVYCTESGGINPVNLRSEFAGLPLTEQQRKIREGVAIFKEHDTVPHVFFAPSHTFDNNTIEALKSESQIRIISDTVANRPYCENGMTFVPQQSGRVRKLPFDVVTFCYHPNTMQEKDFVELEEFLKAHKAEFIDFPQQLTSRKKDLFDKFLHTLYFYRKKKSRR